jgi:hypothetical protein
VVPTPRHAVGSRTVGGPAGAVVAALHGRHVVPGDGFLKQLPVVHACSTAHPKCTQHKSAQTLPSAHDNKLP